jgi:hypothetical protein
MPRRNKGLRLLGLIGLDILIAAAFIVMILGILFFSGESAEFIYMRF